MSLSEYPRHQRMLNFARGEIGIDEDPNGSNTGQRVRWYQSATWLGGTGWPWCAAFCVRAAKQAGFVLRYLGAGAYKWYDDGAAYVGRQIPRSKWREVIPGDWVVFRIGSGHIGIVEKILAGVVYSIDGNSGDQVKRCQRSLNLVYGFVHLKEVPVDIKPKRVPMYEVVTSESGSKALVTRKGKVIYTSGEKAIAKRLGRFLKKYGTVTIRRKRGK